VDRAATTEWSNDRAGALTDLGEVLRLGGDDAGAAAAIDEAIALYEAKENLVEAERLRRRRAAAS
jgi:hypothetical protein